MKYLSINWNYGKEGNVEEIVKEVVEIIRSKYQSLYVDYEYHEDSDVYEIWYDSEEMRYDKEFNMFVGELIDKYFYSRDIYNIFIDYSYTKSKNIDLYKLNSDQNNYRYTVESSALISIPRAA